MEDVGLLCDDYFSYLMSMLIPKLVPMLMLKWCQLLGCLLSYMVIFVVNLLLQSLHILILLVP